MRLRSNGSDAAQKNATSAIRTAAIRYVMPAAALGTVVERCGAVSEGAEVAEYDQPADDRRGREVADEDRGPAGRQVEEAVDCDGPNDQTRDVARGERDEAAQRDGPDGAGRNGRTARH